MNRQTNSVFLNNTKKEMTKEIARERVNRMRSHLSPTEKKIAALEVRVAELEAKLAALTPAEEPVETEQTAE